MPAARDQPDQLFITCTTILERGNSTEPVKKLP